MRSERFPRWIWGFCWAMLPVAVTAMLVANQIEATHAVGQARRSKQTASIRSLSTHQALRVNSKTLDLGALVEGDEVHAQVLIHNIWQRKLRLDVDLQNLPGWTATLEQSVLGPGETALLHLTGQAGEPGELNGRVRIRAMGDYLSLPVSVKGQIAPKPEEPACSAGPSAATAEPIGENADLPAEETAPPDDAQMCAEVTEPPAESVQIELMPRGNQPTQAVGGGD